MDPITIITALSAFAPMLSKWIGASDKVQDIASKASEIAGVITGKASVADQISELQANPELAAKFNLAIIDQENLFETLYVSDLADARKRDLALQATPAGNVRANWLVAVIIVGIFVILFVIITKSDLNEYAKGALTTILGLFLQKLDQVFSFEFGTTRRSRDKGDALDQLKGK